MTKHDFLEMALYILLAIFGTAARELRRLDQAQLKWPALVSGTVIAAFGAAIAYFIAAMSALPAQMGYILAGLVGWSGPDMIDKLFERNTDAGFQGGQACEGEMVG